MLENKFGYNIVERDSQWDCALVPVGEKKLHAWVNHKAHSHTNWVTQGLQGGEGGPVLNDRCCISFEICCLLDHHILHAIGNQGTLPSSTFSLLWL